MLRAATSIIGQSGDASARLQDELDFLRQTVSVHLQSPRERRGLGAPEQITVAGLARMAML